MVQTKKNVRRPKVEDEDAMFDLESLKDKLRIDTNWKKFQSISQTVRDSIDLDTLLDEADTLHESRISSTLKGTNPGPGRLSEAVLQDNAYRSRMSRMWVKITRQKGALEEAIDTIRSYILYQYTDYIPPLRTKESRISFLNQLMKTTIKYKAKMETTLKCLDFYIKDIDSGHWQIKISYDCLNLTYGKGANEKNL